MRFNAATLNVFKRNSADEVYADLREATRHASVFGLQEAKHKGASRAVRRLRRTRRYSAYRPHGPAKENTIFWDRHVWRALRGRSRAYTHGGHSRVTPKRSVVWLPLEHKATGKRILFMNTHAINGYSHAHNNAEGLRDRLAQVHWSAVRSVARKAISSGDYDAVVLVGDFNCSLGNRERSFYPGSMLDGLFEFDRTNSIDRITIHGGDIERRWSRTVHSDHRLQLATLSA